MWGIAILWDHNNKDTSGRSPRDHNNAILLSDKNVLSTDILYIEKLGLFLNKNEVMGLLNVLVNIVCLFTFVGRVVAGGLYIHTQTAAGCLRLIDRVSARLAL